MHNCHDFLLSALAILHHFFHVCMHACCFLFVSPPMPNPFLSSVSAWADSNLSSASYRGGGGERDFFMGGEKGVGRERKIYPPGKEEQ